MTVNAKTANTGVQKHQQQLSQEEQEQQRHQGPFF